MASFIAYIQALSFKLVNFIFGKTTVFIILIGWYLVITGLLFLVKPAKARAKLASSGFGIAKVNILLICFFLWGALSRVSQALPGIWQSLVFWGGLAGLVILFIKARSVAKKKLVALAERVPMKALLWFAWAQVAVGGLMVYLQRRLW